MKSGHQLKTERAPIRMAPPGVSLTPAMTVEQGIQALQKVDEWSVKPAREAAEALSESVQKVADTPAAPVPPAPKSKKGQGASMPWEGAVGTEQLNVRIPAELLEKLRWLGGTTYGESVSSIVRNALEREVKRMFKEREGS